MEDGWTDRERIAWMIGKMDGQASQLTALFFCVPSSP